MDRSTCIQTNTPYPSITTNQPMHKTKQVMQPHQVTESIDFTVGDIRSLLSDSAAENHAYASQLQTELRELRLQQEVTNNLLRSLIALLTSKR